MNREEIDNLFEQDGLCITDWAGKILYFDTATFVDGILDGQMCFVCGAKPNTTIFNNEHVIPDWILSMFSLPNRTLTLPNQAQIKYGQYTVPCCMQCNGKLSEVFESLLSQVLKNGYLATIEHLTQNGPKLILGWLSLLFFKVYLKDTRLRFHLDQRKGSATVGELYDWSEMHHIHCIARAFYTEAEIDPAVFGSLVVCPVSVTPGEEGFDYCDSYTGRTILVRIGDLAMIAVLNDAGAVRSYMREPLQKISAPLSPLQLRELMVRMAHNNTRLITRPQFQSGFDILYSNNAEPNRLISDGTYIIRTELPKDLRFEKLDPLKLGEMLSIYLKDHVAGNTTPDEASAVLEEIRTGCCSFILDEKGNFMPHAGRRGANFSVTDD